ncbi:MAG: hypothetical protein ACYDA9_15265 [Terriglobia bacterium]
MKGKATIPPTRKAVTPITTERDNQVGSLSGKYLPSRNRDR